MRLEEDGGGAHRHALAYEYDFLKQLTTLALFGLGGIVTLAGSIFAEVENKRDLAVAAGLLVVAAVTALQGQNALVDWARRPNPAGPPSGLYRWIGSAALGAGSGVILSFASRALA